MLMLRLKEVDFTNIKNLIEDYDYLLFNNEDRGKLQEWIVKPISAIKLREIYNQLVAESEEYETRHKFMQKNKLCISGVSIIVSIIAIAGGVIFYKKKAGKPLIGTGLVSLFVSGAFVVSHIKGAFFRDNGDAKKAKDLCLKKLGLVVQFAEKQSEEGGASDKACTLEKCYLNYLENQKKMIKKDKEVYVQGDGGTLEALDHL